MMSKIVGITGGIATGKSTVSFMLKKWRYPVICGDKIAHHAIKPNKPAYKKIIAVFGKNILRKNKTLNRNKIAKIVFSNTKMLKKLEKIIHPEVRKVMHERINFYQNHKEPVIFLDIPLLFEAKLDKICDRTLCVALAQKQQIQRLKKYRKMSVKEARARIHAQMPLTLKIKKANAVIWNSGTQSELKQKIKMWLKKEQVHGE